MNVLSMNHRNSVTLASAEMSTASTALVLFCWGIAALGRTKKLVMRVWVETFGKLLGLGRLVLGSCKQPVHMNSHLYMLCPTQQMLHLAASGWVNGLG